MKKILENIGSINWYLNLSSPIIMVSQKNKYILFESHSWGIKILGIKNLLADQWSPRLKFHFATHNSKTILSNLSVSWLSLKYSV